jgi:ATP-dependent Clp endopeptidase proteolytic subunit ClpP
MKLPWFSLLNRGATQPLEILIYGTIGDEEAGLDAASLVNAITAAGDRPLRLRVNSDGGGVQAAIAIYNALSKYPGPTEADIEGWACSAASWIVMACKTVRMAENGMLMIHRAGGGAAGNADDMARAAQLLGNIDDIIAKTYAARTKLPLAQIEQMMDAETWMTAEQAKSLGFVDEVTAALQMAAHFDTSKFRNAPGTIPKPDDMKILNKPLATLLANLSGATITEDSAEADIQNALNGLVKKADLDAANKKVTDITGERDTARNHHTATITLLAAASGVTLTVDSPEADVKNAVAGLVKKTDLDAANNKVTTLTGERDVSNKRVGLLEKFCTVNGIDPAKAVVTDPLPGSPVNMANLETELAAATTPEARHAVVNKYREAAKTGNIVK